MTDKNTARQQLSNLLGPAADEIGCEDCFEQLDRYVEAELAGSNPDQLFPGLLAHLAGCPACREEHDSLRALRLHERNG